MIRTRRRAGSAVVGARKPRSAKPRVERVPTVVVLHPDGFLQVYGPRDKLDVRIVPMMDVEPEGEVLAEQYAELSLPRRHRSIFQPDHLAAIAHVKDCPAPVREWERQANLELIRAVNAERTRNGK